QSHVSESLGQRPQNHLLPPHPPGFKHRKSHHRREKRSPRRHGSHPRQTRLHRSREERLQHRRDAERRHLRSVSVNVVAITGRHEKLPKLEHHTPQDPRTHLRPPPGGLHAGSSERFPPPVQTPVVSGNRHP